ncbi:MAG TPA: ABC transporter permease [Terriglobales bacterium]|nr:ABC transporter permease [Terriglobales bacterium]
MRRFPLRTGAVLLGGSLAAALVLAAINYTGAGRRQVLGELDQMGTDLLTVTARLSRSVGGRARTGAIVTTLQAGDVAALRRSCPEIVDVAEVSSGSFLVKAGDLSKNGAAVVGVGADFFRLRHWAVASGQGFGAAELRRFARVALVGASVARELWGNASPVGQRLLINRVPFRVLGVLQERGQRLDAVNEDDQVYIPVTTAQQRLLNRSYYSAVFLQVAPASALARVQRQATAMLRQRHRLLASLPDDFQVQNQQSLIAAQQAAGERLAQLVRAAGGGGLLAASLAILGLNWLAVGARAAEIGVRRALGATANDIFRQFFVEAAILALLMAGLAAAAGWVFTRLALRQAGLPWTFDFRAAVAVIALSALLNLVFAVLPARRAARLDPVAVLAA